MRARHQLQVAHGPAEVGGEHRVQLRAQRRVGKHGARAGRGEREVVQDLRRHRRIELLAQVQAALRLRLRLSGSGSSACRPGAAAAPPGRAAARSRACRSRRCAAFACACARARSAGSKAGARACVRLRADRQLELDLRVGRARRCQRSAERSAAAVPVGRRAAGRAASGGGSRPVPSARVRRGRLACRLSMSASARWRCAPCPFNGRRRARPQPGARGLIGPPPARHSPSPCASAAASRAGRPGSPAAADWRAPAAARAARCAAGPCPVCSARSGRRCP